MPDIGGMRAADSQEKLNRVEKSGLLCRRWRCAAVMSFRARAPYERLLVPGHQRGRPVEAARDRGIVAPREQVGTAPGGSWIRGRAARYCSSAPDRFCPVDGRTHDSGA